MAAIQLLNDLLRKLPSRPGIYQFVNSDGVIIYIGKAKNLKNRVKSYFAESAEHGAKNKRLVEKIADLKWIETNSEMEALTLESNLVKEHQPKFNVLLRDDKHFLYFKITKEKYPKFLAVRKVEKDGAKYFGPKTDSKAVRETLKLLEKFFHTQVCLAHLEKNDSHIAINRKMVKLPCPFFGMGMCGGPVLDAETAENYAQFTERAAAFLAGDSKRVASGLKEAMQTAARSKNFEHAARLRDQLAAIEAASERQLVSEPSLASRDVLGVSIDGGRAYFAVLEVRNGKLIDQKNFIVSTGERDEAEVLASFLRQFYGDVATDLPREILLPVALAESESLADWLGEKARGKVNIFAPQRGTKSGLVKLAAKNAAAWQLQNKAKYENASARTVQAAAELAEKLGIKKKLQRIECYDISHLGGEATVGSMVVAIDGEPRSSEYRQFKIRELEKNKIDDFAAMAEVLKRRMSYLIDQNINIKIRRANKKDSVYLEPFRWRDYKTDEICDELSEWWLAEKNEKIVCRMKLKYWNKEKIWGVYGLEVDESERGNKLGIAMIKKALAAKKVPKAYLDCRSELINYYGQIGFQFVRVVPELLRDNLKKYCERNQKEKSLLQNEFMVWNRKTQQADPSFAAKPDLVVLDGGKGQISSVLKSVQLPKTTTLVGLAKRHEEIWLAERKTDKKKKMQFIFTKVQLGTDSNAEYLATRLRDEAHRTANNLRKKILKKTDLQSELDELAGIGIAAKKKLLAELQTVDKIKEANLVDLQKILGTKIGAKLHRQLH